MKRLFVLALFVCTCTCVLSAQAVDTDVCAIVKNPKSFDGKTVRIKGTVVAGLDEFIVKSSTGPCGFPVDGIWLDYPQGTKGKAGALAVLEVQPAHNFSGAYTAPTRGAVTLDKSKEFKQFDSLLSQGHNKGASLCLGCERYEVNATLTGRLDGVADAALQRDQAGKVIAFGGFGNMNAYPARLVLESVTDVTPKEIDYSKSDAATKTDAALRTEVGEFVDPLAAAKKILETQVGSAAGTQGEKDIAIFGKPGEHTGVSIISGATNEADSRQEALGAKDSPDGVLYNCIFSQRVDGLAKVLALMHLAHHVSDLQTVAAIGGEVPLYVYEYNAWSMTAAMGVASGLKHLTMPGGNLLWDISWTDQERSSQMDEALKSFLTNQAALSR
jgi:hypothetical protein